MPVELTVDSIESAVVPAKPLTGKYDGRSLSRLKRERMELLQKARESNKIQRSDAELILKSLGGRIVWQQLFEWSAQEGDRRLCFEILRYLKDRVEGKPHTAEPNNNQSKQVDNRLQVAISNLVVNTGESKVAAKGRRGRKPKAQPALTGEIATGKVQSELTQTPTTDPSSQKEGRGL